MKLAEGVAVLPLEIGGFTLNPTLIWDENGAVLVDTGMPGQSEQIIEAIEKAGVPIDYLKSVILTHQDIDHIGSLPALLEKSGNPITVYAHKLDAPYIEGKLPLIKLDFPAELQHFVKHPPKAKVNQVLNDGDELPICGGMHVIFTPGHTPGHISLYLKQSKILIAGDALFNIKGELKGPVSQTTPDLPTAQNSLRAFLNYDIEKVICFHGGVCSKSVNEQLQVLVNAL